MTGQAEAPGRTRRRNRRSVRQWWRSWEWPVVGLAAVIGLVLGCIGFWFYFRDEPAWNRHPWEILYKTIQLLPLQFSWFNKPLHWTLQVARFLLPTLAVYAAVKGLAALYVEQLQVLRVRLFARNHTIICGLGQKGLLLARRLRERGERVVVIERNEENDLVRAARDVGCVVMFGDATEPYMLNRAGISHARHLVAVCRDDGMNAEIAVQAKGLVRQYGGNLHCVCHIFDARLWALLNEQPPIPDSLGGFRLEFRNIYKEGAAELLKSDPHFPDPAAEACPHALVVGVGRMGESLLVELTGRWRAVRRSDKDRFHITMVDRQALAKHRFLLSEYPQFAGVWCLKPAELDVNTPQFQEGGFLTDAGAVQRVYVCLDDDSLGLMAAFRIQQQLRARSREVAVIVRTRQQGGLAALLNSIDDPSCPPHCVKAFGLLDHTCRPELWLDRADRPAPEKGTQP